MVSKDREQLLDEIDTLKQRLKTMMATNDELDHKMTEAEEKANEMQDKIDRLNNDLSKERREHDKLDAELQAIQDEFRLRMADLQVLHLERWLPLIRAVPSVNTFDLVQDSWGDAEGDSQQRDEAGESAARAGVGEREEPEGDPETYAEADVAKGGSGEDEHATRSQPQGTRGEEQVHQRTCQGNSAVRILWKKFIWLCGQIMVNIMVNNVMLWWISLSTVIFISYIYNFLEFYDYSIVISGSILLAC